MPIEPSELTIKLSADDSVSGLLYSPNKEQRAGVTLILGHGAGANQTSAFMRLFANGLAERGLDVLTFNFLYMEKGKSIPDPAPKLEACYRAVINAAHDQKKLKGNRIAIGGKSMGGRIASQVAAQQGTGALPDGRASAPRSPAQGTFNEKDAVGGSTNSEPGAVATGSKVSALVFLGYPLHPPGRPDKLRDAHLPHIKAPMLFIQGSRDAFGSSDEIQAVIKRLKLPATLYAVEGADHSLKVPKKGGVPQEKVYEDAMDVISRWLKSK